MSSCNGNLSASEFGDILQLQIPSSFTWNELVLDLTGPPRRFGIQLTVLLDRKAPP